MTRIDCLDMGNSHGLGSTIAERNRRLDNPNGFFRCLERNIRTGTSIALPNLMPDTDVEALGLCAGTDQAVIHTKRDLIDVVCVVPMGFNPIKPTTVTGLNERGKLLARKSVRGIEFLRKSSNLIQMN